ncbi:MAG: fused MFS/spermidine synthase [Thermodesulfovibrionales bacterium]|nr:fused MFS/spermidine synthase [Thermodesulfovibrionales bacterium]
MYFEITTAKMIIPFYGASLKVWATVLCAVLSGLCLGYYLGARINLRSFPSLSSFIAGILILLLPFITPFYFKVFHHFGHNTGIILSSFFICLMPSVFFAMMSPCLVNIICKNHENTGNTAGIIFAVSTLGGVIFAIVAGFWLIPLLGVTNSCLLISSLLFFVTLGFSHLLDVKNMRTLSISLIALSVVISIFYGTAKRYPEFIKYKNVGFYGELIVADLIHEKDGKVVKARLLLNNRIAQSFINLETGLSEWRYIQYLDLLSSIKPAGKNALMLGLAGGSLANEMIDMGFHVDAVDIDDRVYKIALKYFNLNPECRFYPDDARHFINSVSKRYDIVIIDLFAAESQPFHIFTLESFKRIHEILNDDGFVLINFHESVTGDKGKGLRSTYKTMLEAGFITNYINTSEREEEKNNILIGSKTHLDWQKAELRKKSYYQKRGINLPIRIKSLPPEMTKNDYILTDNNPVFEVINEEAFREWREHAIQNYLLGLDKMGMPIL